MPRFILQALTGEPLTVHGDGHASRDWLFVDDDAEALEALVEAPLEDVAGEVVNVATASTSRSQRLPGWSSRPWAPPGRRSRSSRSARDRSTGIGSTDKLARLTGWRARTSFVDGLERTVAWYRENEVWWRKLLGQGARVSSS